MSRETRQKSAIIGFLKKTGIHPTADLIYEHVRKELPDISKGTVYRNLKVLQETGQIQKLDLKGSISRYEGNKEKHYHFKCERCGEVYDVDGPVDKLLEARVSRATGFKVTGYQLEFRGICKRCR
jgi:Fur family peroxide stress response transcriptional regulator